MSKPVILVTGCLGQLGNAIQQHWEASHLTASHELLAVDVDQLDLTDAEDVNAYLDQLQPAVIINAAAFTDVDGAESNQEAAYAVNAEAVSSLAAWCAMTDCKLIHVSTDFVFEGTSTTPYSPEAETAPLSVYGASKLEGERHVLEKLPKTGYVVRTSWLYSEFGGNFVKTMLRLMGERDELKVVNDQIGSPTSAHTLALFLLELVRAEAPAGTYHWTDGGEMSWFEFAVAIQELGAAVGLVPGNTIVIAIPSSDYPTPAMRPAYSVLDRTTSLTLLGAESEDWQSALRRVLDKLARIVS